MSELLKPRKSPRQSRSRASYEAVLAAAAQVLEAGGYAALNTNLVAERAGVSIGTLYQYFPNKETIAAELVRRLRADMRRDIQDAIARAHGKSLTQTAWVIIEASVYHHTRAPVLARILEAIEADLPLDDDTSRAKEHVFADLVGVLQAHAVADARRAAVDLSAIVEALVHSAIKRGDEDLHAVTHRSYNAVCGYLGFAPAEVDKTC